LITFNCCEDLKLFLSTKVHLLLDKEVTLHEETELDNMGLDSIKMIQLIVAIEEEMEMEFDPEDYLPDNFTSISSIANFLIRKYGVLASE
jgi:acyl carrier protein